MGSFTYVDSIARVIYDYAKQEKKIDDAYVTQVAEIITKEENLQNFVLNKNFTNESAMGKDTSGEYIPEDRTIYFRLKELNTTYKRIDLEPHSKKAKKYIRYVVGNEIIIHEFGHALLLKKCFSRNNDIETQILRMVHFDDIPIRDKILFMKDSFEVLKTCDEKVYDKNSKFAPEERLADLYAYSMLQKVTESLGTKELYDYETYSLYKTYLKAYKKQKNPTFYYLNQLGFSNTIRDLEEETISLPFEERLRLGLFLNEEEYKQVHEEYKRIKKKIC